LEKDYHVDNNFQQAVFDPNPTPTLAGRKGLALAAFSDKKGVRQQTTIAR
jgi:hypothetical protein